MRRPQSAQSAANARDRGLQPQTRRATALSATPSWLKRCVHKRLGSSKTKSNAVHPICSVAPLPEAAKPADASSLHEDAGCNGMYTLSVRVLHALDLVDPCAGRNCGHAFAPSVQIALNVHNSKPIPVQSSAAAAQHGRNLTMWKDSVLVFQCERSSQSSGIVALRATVVSSCCTTSRSMVLGQLSEIRMALGPEDYEIAQFFSLFEQEPPPGQRPAFRPVCVGRLKLRIRIEKQRPVPVATPVAHPSAPVALAPVRPASLFPSGLQDALQLKRKQLKATVTPEAFTPSRHEIRATENASHCASMLETLKQEIPEILQFSSDAIRVKEPIGEGVHSCVYHALLARSSDGSGQEEDVAVKEFRYLASLPPLQVLTTFRHEYQMLAACSSSTSVIRSLGVILQPRLTILTEFVRMGSLAKCLKNEALWSQVSIAQKARIALQIAQGLAWMHTHDLIHRDVKSHNIVLDHVTSPTPVAKICDLGSAIRWRSGDPLIYEEVGSSGYTAPEIFMQQGYDRQVDVWSFGVVLWELTSDASRVNVNPFSGLAVDAFLAAVQSGERPMLHAEQDPFWVLIDHCWELRPENRPSMDAVVEQLQAIADKMQ